MNDNSVNKVAYPCAGKPVIRRIVDNMRQAGVDIIVIVVGFKAQSVMDALSDVPGVIYVYQKEQCGTGHAALCGMKALHEIGFRGKAIVSMGDKIVAPDVVRGLLDRSEGNKVVWGVQPVQANRKGGRVIVRGEKAYGVVEYADAALMKLTELPEDQWSAELERLDLTSKKADKVLKAARAGEGTPTKQLGGEIFSAYEIMSTPYANAGLYCFDVEAGIGAINECRPMNAQGEIYLTDTLELLAEDAAIYEVRSKEDMLTFSTKPELRQIGLAFLRTVSQMLADLDHGGMDAQLSSLYGTENLEAQKARYRKLLSGHMAEYGDRKTLLTRAPGRVNLMGRHIDHRGGGINVMATDRDSLFAVSPREDDVITAQDVERPYPDEEFTISRLMKADYSGTWLEFLDEPAVKNDLAETKGRWINYIKSAVYRLQMISGLPLCGMDISISGSIPVAAGLSSSSSLVVAAAEAVVALNCLSLGEDRFVELCGEAEWYVGSRGGAGDHAAIKCCRSGSLTHIDFKPMKIGDSVKMPEGYAVIVADSTFKAKKSEGSKDTFNAKVAAYEIALKLLQKKFPGRGLEQFRDIAAFEQEKIYEMMLALPEKMTRREVEAELGGMERLFATHSDPGAYDVRGVALFGVCECLRAAECLHMLETGDCKALGEMMKTSHMGDSVSAKMPVDDGTILRLRAEGFDLSKVPGAYGCSIPEIDEMCRLLNATDGVLGCELAGAGLGGSVIVLVEKDKAAHVKETLGREFYDKKGLPRSAEIYLPSSGASVMV